MNEPTTLPPLVEPQNSAANYWRWILVFCFFSLVIWMTLEERSMRSGKEKVGVSSSQVMQVQIALQMESMARFSESLNSTENTLSYRRTSASQLSESLRDASETRTKSIEHAALYASIATALDRPVPPEVLAKLAKGKSPEAKALSEIYASERLSEKRSRELAIAAERMPEIGRFAAYQALEKGGDTHALQSAFPKERFFILIALIMVMVGGFFGGIAAWIFYFANRRKDAWRMPDHPFSYVTRSQASVLGLFSVALMGLFMVNGELFATALKGQPDHIIIFGSSFIFLLILLALAVTMRLGGKTLYSGLNQSPFSMGKQVFLGVAGWAANLPVIGIMMVLLKDWIANSNAEHPMNEMLSSGGGPAATFALFFAAAVVAPVWEEVAFRGALFGGLRVALSRFKLGLPVAIFLTSFAFAAIHPQGPALWLMLGWLSVTGCFLTYRTRSIIPAMVMHAVHNGMLFLMSITMVT